MFLVLSLLLLLGSCSSTPSLPPSDQSGTAGSQGTTEPSSASPSETVPPGSSDSSSPSPVEQGSSPFSAGFSEPVSDSPTPATNPESSTCGNGVVETGEECDDGNTRDGDGCSSDCQWQDIEPSPIPWSINLHPENVSEYTNDLGKPSLVEAIARILDLGAGAVRFDIPWRDLQPTEGSLTDDNWDYHKWSLLRASVAYAKDQGLEPIVVLSRPPQWAIDHYKSGNGEQYWREWQRYCHKAVLELDSSISYYSTTDLVLYQVGNEANLGWPAPPAYQDPIDQADDWRQFTECRQGIETDEYHFAVLVNIHADSLGWEQDLTNWLMLAGSAIDIIGIDHYPGSHYLNDGTDWYPLQTLLANYLGNGRLGAVTETGFTSSLFNLGHLGATEEDQKDWINTALPIIKKMVTGRKDLLFANFYELYDGNSDGINPEDHYGVLTSDGQRTKPGYQALKDQIRGRAAGGASASSFSFTPIPLPLGFFSSAGNDCRDQIPEDSVGDGCIHTDGGFVLNATGSFPWDNQLWGESACGDLDGGRDYYHFGYLISSRETSVYLADLCTYYFPPGGGYTVLLERYCLGNVAMTEQYRCPYGCASGVCRDDICADGSPLDSVGNPCDHWDCPDFSAQDSVGDGCNHGDGMSQNGPHRLSCLCTDTIQMSACVDFSGCYPPGGFNDDLQLCTQLCAGHGGLRVSLDYYCGDPNCSVLSP